MTPIFKKLVVATGPLLIALSLAVTANASCGDKPVTAFHRQAWEGSAFSVPGLVLINEDNDPIVGLWHVTFTAHGNNPGPPNGTPIDNALVTWHRDGTEIMNSGRPPQDGQFCMGVWKRTGYLRYQLNHFAWAGNDTANAPTGIGNPAGPTHITETILLSPDGNHYVGTFTLDAYDTDGNSTAHIVGVIQATRITINTTVKDLL